MRLFFAICILLLSLHFPALAQGNADSLYFFKQDRASTAFSLTNGTQLLSSGIERSGIAHIGFSGYDGHFRRVQEAETGREAMLYTEGVSTLNRFKFSGSFSFGRVWQDSLAWSAKGTEDDMTPYYYGSIKAGTFERLAYAMVGTAIYEVLRGKLYAGTNISYGYRTSTRSVDPRPEVNQFDLYLAPELSLRLGNHLLGGGVRFGFGSENINIDYKNTDFKLSLGYPDRINYYLRGYGSLDKTRHGAQTDVKTKRASGALLNYVGTFRSLDVRLRADYGQAVERNGKELTNSGRDTISSEFVLNTLNADLLVTRRSESNSQQFSAHVSFFDGYDNDLRVGASGYFYTRTFAEGSYLIRFTEKKVMPEFGAGFMFDAVQRRDIGSAHSVDHSIVEPRLESSLYGTNVGGRWDAGLVLAYRMPVASSISVPQSQETVFTTGVIYPDYDYNTSSAVRVSGELGYITNTLFEQFDLGIRAGVTYLSRLDSQLTFANSTFVTGKSRLSFRASLNLYF